MVETQTEWSAWDAAALGAAFLDGYQPQWEWDVDLKTLDIGHPEECITGQLFGGTATGTPPEMRDDATAWRYGTIAPAAYDDEEGEDAGEIYEAQNQLLTRAWKAEIERRRAA